MGSCVPPESSTSSRTWRRWRLTQRRIATVTGIHRGTVKMWLAGAVPQDSPDCCGACRRPPGGPYSYLLGLYLGDGHVSTYARTPRLRIFCDSRYPGLIGEGVRAVGRVVPTSRVHAARRPPDNCVVISSWSRCWLCLLPQHGPGRKHERAIELEPWQRAITHAHPEAFVRGLLHSDGCRFINPVRVRGRRYEYPRYFFTNESADIKRLFCEHLDLLGIEWRPCGRRNISIARLDEFVGPKR